MLVFVNDVEWTGIDRLYAYLKSKFGKNFVSWNKIIQIKCETVSNSVLALELALPLENHILGWIYLSRLLHSNSCILFFLSRNI